MIKLTAALLLMCCAVAHADTRSGPISVTVVPAGTISSDGSKISGGTGQLVTADGIWTFGAASTQFPGNWDILLNGSVAGVWLTTTPPVSSELEVANNGGMYISGGDSRWYKWVNKGWIIVGNPIPPPPVASITVDNLNPKAGDTITITYDPKASKTSPTDRIQLNYVSPQWTCNVPVGSGGSALNVSVAVPSAAPGPHTVQLRIPMVPSDVPQHYRAELWQIVPADGSISACQGGGLNDMAVAATPTITVAPTITTTYPVGSLTYPPPGWPAQPNETITVCASGCQFNTLDAVSHYVQNSDQNRDWIKVDVQAGDYLATGSWANPSPCNGLPGGKCVEHIWFYGHGATRPHLTCSSELPYIYPYVYCAGIMSTVGIHTVVDNFDIGPSVKAGANSAAMGPIICEGTLTDSDTTLYRNLYLHDGGDGVLTGSGCKYEVTFQNSHVARFGGPVGPAHDVYFNNSSPDADGGQPGLLYDGHLVIDHSVFELAEIGHTVKSHANRFDINCSIVTNGTSEDYSGSQTLDLDGGGGQVTVNNSVIVGGQYFYNSFANSPWFMEFGGDKSAWNGDQPKQFVVFNNSYIINDRGQFMLALSAPMTPDASLPYKSSNNVFIGTWDDSGTPSVCGGSLPCTSPVSKWDLGRWADMDFGCPLAPNGANDCRPLRDTGNKSSTGNLFFSTRAQARAHAWPTSASPIQDLPTRTDQGGTVYTAAPYDPKLYPMPAACSGPVGNVQWPL